MKFQVYIISLGSQDCCKEHHETEWGCYEKAVEVCGRQYYGPEFWSYCRWWPTSCHSSGDRISDCISQSMSLGPEKETYH